MALTQTTAPVVEPITTSEAKSHLRVDGSDEDTYIGSLIVAAREFCETYQGRAYVTQTWTLTLDGFPMDGKGHIDIPLPPLQSVESVVYIAADGTSTTWAAENYVVDTKSAPGRLALAPDASWPTTQSGRINAVTITFVAGYGLAAAVPDKVKQAMYLLLGHWYVNRETEVTGTIVSRVGFAVDGLLGQDRIITF